MKASFLATKFVMKTTDGVAFLKRLIFELSSLVRGGGRCDTCRFAKRRFSLAHSLRALSRESGSRRRACDQMQPDQGERALKTHQGLRRGFESRSKGLRNTEETEGPPATAVAYGQSRETHAVRSSLQLGPVGLTPWDQGKVWKKQKDAP